MISHGGIHSGKPKIWAIENIMQWVWGVGAIGVWDVGAVYNIYTQEVPINMSLELSTISQLKDIRGVYTKLFKGGGGASIYFSCEGFSYKKEPAYHKETIDFTDPGGGTYVYLNLIFYCKQWPFNLKQNLKGNKDISMNSVRELQTWDPPFLRENKIWRKRQSKQ